MFVERLTLALILLLAAGAPPARAGHELPFYPGYYPQEIRIEALSPAAAAPLLRNGTLHAYVGGDPFAGGRLPAHVTSVDSLGGYLVARFNPAPPDAEARCAAAARAGKGLGGPRAGHVAHPYAITPYHADYLQHWDLAQAARKAVETAPAGPPARPVTVEEVDLQGLLAAHAIGAGGTFAPPWLKEGWFHAYLLQAPAITDPAARQAVDGLYRRLTTFAYDGAAERAELERRLVQRLAAGCERPVLGYTVRREPFNSEFSQGIENIGWDSQRGFNSEIFVRTAKLKDFPWNGWLKVGVAGRATAAWNPVAGFTDAPGRLLWAAVGDPGLIPAPYAAGFVPHRAVPAQVAVAGPSGFEVPEDALLPEAGTGALLPVGKGKTAKARVTYRLWGSAAHDNTRVSAADALYPYVFAARWSARRAPGHVEHDPAVEAATETARQALVGRPGGEGGQRGAALQRHHVHLRGAGDRGLSQRGHRRHRGAGRAGAAVERDALARARADGGSGQAGRGRVLGRGGAPARRRAGSISRATRRRARSSARSWTGSRARTTSRRRSSGWWRPTRRRPAGPRCAQFAQRRGHYLVTNGPYQLEKWTDGAVVLGVFRDMNNPLGRRQLRSLRHPAACLRCAHHRARRPPRDRAGDRAAGEVPPGVSPRPRAARLPRR